MSCAAKSADRPWWAASVLAATTMPEVSLSMRWTMPGRATPPMPDRLSPQWCNRALTRVPLSLPGGGVPAIPLTGLYEDEHRIVLVKHGERDGLGHRLGGDRGRDLQPI